MVFAGSLFSRFARFSSTFATGHIPRKALRVGGLLAPKLRTTPLCQPTYFHRSSAPLLQRPNLRLQTAMAEESAKNQGFRLVAKTKANQSIDVCKYVSERTGLTITLADVEGPLVRGAFTLATETHDDAGLPHTLEHLVFMGSEQFPYKGVLDVLANRCFASGTNAWTDTDHTAYELVTAGAQGFLKLLPVYLDHILFPQLTESQYLTEVHHINGDGENAGVVYCEMQDHEGQPDHLVHWEVQKHLYPDGCGYGVETGGRLHAIRHSCSHHRVTDFHKQFYHPRNLCLIIAGRIAANDVFRALQGIEEKCLKKERVIDAPRPWQSPVPPFTDVVEKRVACPSVNAEEDAESEEGVATSESTTKGVVEIAWRGPRIEDLYAISALDVLCEYLTETAISPMQREFVQIPDPYCSKVNLYLERFAESGLVMKFKGVPCEKLSLIKERAFETLSNVANRPAEFDYNRLQDIIRQSILQSLCSLEDSPHDAIVSAAIQEFLHSKSEKDFDIHFNDVTILKRLANEPLDFWIQLLRRWLSKKRPYVSVVSEPSCEHGRQVVHEEQKRIEEQKCCLGPDGLANCAERMEKAVSDNEDAEVPDEILEHYSVKTLEGLEFFDVSASNNLVPEKANANPNFPLADLPISFMLDDVKTNFVELTAQLDTSGLSTNQRMLLQVYLELLFESPLIRNGEIVQHDTVVKELNADVISNYAGIGIHGSFTRILSIVLKLDKEKYLKGISWLRELIYALHLDAERIRVVAQRIRNGADAKKRAGQTMAGMLMNALSYEQDSNLYLYSILRQEKFLEKLLKRLDSNPNEVIEDFKQLQVALTEPHRLIVHLTANAKSLTQVVPQPEKAWLCVVPPERFLERSDSKAKIYPGKEPLFLKPPSEWGKAYLLPLSGCESSFVWESVPGISNHLHPDLPALMVLVQYFNQCEGPLWRTVRGHGLAYGANVRLWVDAGLLTLELYRCTHADAAYAEAVNVLKSIVSKGDEELDELLFESAKSSLMFEVIEQESTVSEASHESLLSYYRGTPPNHNKELLKRILAVQIEDLPRVGEQFLAPLFDASKTNLAVTCNAGKANEVLQGFKKLGRDLKQTNLDDSLLVGY